MIETQDTIIGKYKDKVVVACKDFRDKDENFVDFASLKNTVIDAITNGYDTELSGILQTITNQQHFKIQNNEIKEFFWICL
ncbi:hypothetical protein [Campylobacter pinnipediorum]|uniref:hypothetical protein n=1 Tax=Campylobacter pinnipediorum TaxID=1965231 RepID=UPI00099502C8|nr:hypothetical protein [Campylobacter pinnipediorum]